MMLGYSELVRRITGVSPATLSGEYATLLRAKPTQRRYAQLRMLAQRRRATVSELLRACGEPHTGGSFRAAAQFFERLVALKILRKTKVGRRTYYEFTDASTLAQWLRAGTGNKSVDSEEDRI